MCRNIKTLFNFEPPATDDEIRASANQFVRKLSGFTKPSKANELAFERAVDDVAAVAMRLITSPSEFDVIVTANMFGDILTDEISVLSGSLGLLPSASLGKDRLGLYEPIHGSAPTIAGKSIANPLGTILSSAMLLRHSLQLESEARQVEMAVGTVLNQGLATPDLGGTTSTQEMGAAVRAAIRSIQSEPAT